MAYSADTFVADEQPTTAKWNKLWSNDASFNDGTGIGTGAVASASIANNAVSIVRLNVAESTDFANGSGLTANTWTDHKANQNFTVGSANSIIAISIAASSIIGASAVTASASRIVIDSGGTPQNINMGGSWQITAGGYTNPFAGAGTIYITGLAAGVHTVKSQVIASASGNSQYCRCATGGGFEHYRTQVVEFLK